VGNLSLPAPHFRLFRWRLSAPYGLAPCRPTGCSLIRPCLVECHFRRTFLKHLKNVYILLECIRLFIFVVWLLPCILPEIGRKPLEDESGRSHIQRKYPWFRKNSNSSPQRSLDIRSCYPYTTRVMWPVECQNNNRNAKFEVSTELMLKIQVFCVGSLNSRAIYSRRFGGTYRLYLQGSISFGRVVVPSKRRE
jgi:hypothetical protein